MGKDLKACARMVQQVRKKTSTLVFGQLNSKEQKQKLSQSGTHTHLASNGSFCSFLYSIKLE